MSGADYWYHIHPEIKNLLKQRGYDSHTLVGQTATDTIDRVSAAVLTAQLTDA